MKQKLLLIIPTLIFVSAFTPAVNSISFTHDIDQNGNHHSSNLPKFCVSNGVLVCHLNSPLFKGGLMKFSLRPRADSKSSKGVGEK